MNNANPGWYPDNSNPSQVRYWDGQKWTEQTAPAGAPPTGQGYGMTTPAAAPQKNWFMRHKILTGVLAFVVICVVAAAAGGGSSSDADPTSATDSSQKDPESKEEKAPKAEDDAEPAAAADPTKETEQTKEPEPKALRVNATQIPQEFEDNELAADNKYKGQTLLVNGVVDKIDTELFDDEKYILRIGDGGEFEFLTVNCSDMSTDELATLNKGDKVTVRGEFDDGGDLGVEVKDCELP